MSENKLEKQAIQIAEKALYLYFVVNDNESLLKLFSQRHSCWIGWAAHEDYLTYTDIYNTMTARIGEIPYTEMTDLHSRVLLSLPDMYIVYTTCAFHSTAESGFDLHERAKYTFFIGKEPDGLKIWHLHSSTAWNKMSEGEVYPSAYSIEKLSKEENHFDALLPAAVANNTPNGLKCCKIDKNYPSVFINKALYTMAGYTTMNEMLRETNGRLDKLIYSADLPKVQQSMASHIDGSVYTVNYRLLRRENSPIWVIERGQLYKDPDGAKYFICSIAPLELESDGDLCYGSLADASELVNPQLPIELWMKTALEIAASGSDKTVIIEKLLKLTANILQLPGACITSIGAMDEPVKMAYSYYGGAGIPMPQVLPYTPQHILPSFSQNNITQCSDTRIMPKMYYNMLRPLKIRAFYSVLITVNDYCTPGVQRRYVLNLYQQGKTHHWTDNEKDLIEQLTRLCTLLLK